MKKNTFRVTVGCLGVLMLACVSCATTAPPKDMTEAEPVTIEGAETTEASADEITNPEETAGQVAEETGAEEASPVRNFSLSVVQVNNNDKSQADTDENKTADINDSAAGQDLNNRADEHEISTYAEPEENSEEPGKRVATLRRVPSSYKVIQYLPDTSQSLGTESLLSEISQEVAGKVYYELKEEGERNFTAKVAVVNAVPLSDLKRETEFGRIMAEYLLTDLADRGLRVTELRMGKEINILPQTGEFIMSRNIGEIANNAPALDYVVLSTFTNTRKTLIVQGRLVSLKDGLIKTTWRYGLPLNRELLGLFHTAEQPFTIAVKGMGQ